MAGTFRPVHTGRWHPSAVTVPLTHRPALRAGVNEPVSDGAAPMGNSRMFDAVDLSWPAMVRFVRALIRMLLPASPLTSRTAPAGMLTSQPRTTRKAPPTPVVCPFALMSPWMSTLPGRRSPNPSPATMKMPPPVPAGLPSAMSSTDAADREIAPGLHVDRARVGQVGARHVHEDVALDQEVAVGGDVDAAARRLTAAAEVEVAFDRDVAAVDAEVGVAEDVCTDDRLVDEDVVFRVDRDVAGLAGLGIDGDAGRLDLLRDHDAAGRLDLHLGPVGEDRHVDREQAIGAERLRR